MNAAADAAYWSLPATDIATQLGSSPKGLTSAQAAAALTATGPNTLDTQRDVSALRLLARQFLSPIVLILVAATVLSGVLGDLTDAVIILVIILLSGLLGFWQERGAGKAMKSLLAVVQVTATVLRDGTAQEVPLAGIVPGDVALLDGGDLIPGDCIVLESRGLSIDESALTGETFPVDKQPGTSAAASALTERSNAAFLGTHVSSGTGTVLVVRTGQGTEMGSVASHLGKRAPQTGFEIGMTSFGLLLTRAMVVLVVIIFVVNLLLQRPLLDSALFSLALAVGLTPQLLPAIVSISLAQGARAIAKQRVIVRRLDSIEDFGSMNVLCSDKTGTMTEGTVVLSSAIGIDGAKSDEVQRLACLNAGLQVGLDNPIDAAIRAVAAPDPAAQKLDELAYDFNRRLLSVLVAQAGKKYLITKGALDAVLKACTHATAADGSVVPLAKVRPEIDSRFAELSASGFRVLGIARKEMPGAATSTGASGAPGAATGKGAAVAKTPPGGKALAAPELTTADESGMTLVGFLTFADPVKPDAAATIAEFASSGVSVRMLTGDNHLVATHIARQVGLDVTTVLTGTDIDAADDAKLAEIARTVQVFAELNPLQKERIVRAVRADGNVVGYLGDGINDSPSLHAADVGISVDTAVPVAKESAAIVLLEKDLNVLLDGMRQGRRTFANTMKYIFMTTSANFGNMLSMAIASIALPFLPLLAGQILLINLLTDLPATTIATDSVDAAQLAKPQRWNIKLIRNYMIVFGALSSVFDLMTFVVLRVGFHAHAAEFRSAWFLGSVLTEVGVLFVLRTRRPFWLSRPSKWVVLASLVVALVTLGIPYSPLAPLLELVPIPPELLVLILAITLAYLVATELTKRVFWRPSARLS
ncbi:MAG: HAD-IC family P-type ATPase [Rhodoglobus sp.]